MGTAVQGCSLRPFELLASIFGRLNLVPMPESFADRVAFLSADT